MSKFKVVKVLPNGDKSNAYYIIKTRKRFLFWTYWETIKKRYIKRFCPPWEEPFGICDRRFDSVDEALIFIKFQPDIEETVKEW